jgi:PRTRC genetic system protein B
MSVTSIALVINTASIDRADEILTVTAHDIHHGPDKSTLGPGRVFDLASKRALCATLAGHIDNGIELLSPHSLVVSKDTLIWHRPRKKTTVNINGKILAVPMPSFVFALHKSHLYVVAVPGDKRPNHDTPLMVCGMPNVSASGSWCSGGNQLPGEPRQSQIERIEKVFFESPFTHWSSALPKTTGSMEGWYDELSRKSSFPMRSLPKLNRTLESWIEQLNR